ncbi:DcaP family trimeric outer membrane transporter [Halomonas mongoliensis]|uniref:DcaP family trimeric outer membrane transporter n=1 Tax=Halomonas mongoliensis TaxID=321265 RepID=UPI00403B25F1
MSIKKNASIFTASALALAVAGAAQAYTIEAGDTTANIYGYAKLDLIYDVDDKLGNAVSRPAISLSGEPSSTGHTTMHAYQSRLGFTTATPAGGSELKTMIEGDFYGGGGGTFRLRHAYGEWNGLLAGQTWTNFGGFLAMHPTIDFTPAPGIGNAARQAQLRYTVDGFSVALEDPDDLGGKVAGSFAGATDPDSGITGNGAPAAASGAKTRLPDLTMRYQGAAGDFNYAASALLRQVRYDDVGVSSDSATGWGLALEASAKVAEGVTIRGGVTHGDGIGGYLEGNPSAPAYIDPTTGSLETIKATGGAASITVAAGPGNMTLGYGIATADLDDARDASVPGAEGANETFEAVHLNYIWSPIRNVTYGVEVGYHTREVADGRDGDAVRLQGMVMYNF